MFWCRRYPRLPQMRPPISPGLSRAALLTLLAAVLSASVARASGFNGDGPINVTDEGVAVKGYDVVAYFTEGEPVRGLPEHEVEQRGAIFRFASAAHAAMFRQSPGKYMPAYGGFCALGVANGYKDDMHPAAFSIVNGRLFLNLTPRINEHWEAYRRAYRLIERADRNWPELRHARGYGPADAR